MTLNNSKNKYTNSLFIIDTASIIFRSYYAIRNSRSNVLYGFVSTFRRILEKKPKYIVSTMDISRKTFRNEIYPNYKANRDETPEDLKQQIPYVMQFLSLLNIPNFEIKGYEADDIIASITAQFGDKTDNVFIVTKDKDLMQLVQNNVFAYDVYKDIVYNKDLVFEKYAVYPEQILDYLSLVGDTSDNIPGVKGIGPKGASILLKHFSSLENIYNSLEGDIEQLDIENKKIIEKYSKLLSQNKENAILSKKLASLVYNLNLDFSLNNAKLKVPETKSVTDFLQTFSFRQEASRWKELLDKLSNKKVAKQKDLF